MSSDIELAQRHRELTTQFHALATVASNNLPHYMKRSASTGVTAFAGAASGAIQAYAGLRTGTAINAGVAALSLAGAMFYNDKPDVSELGHAVARGLGAGALALGCYNGVADWMEARKSKQAALPAAV